MSGAIFNHHRIPFSRVVGFWGPGGVRISGDVRLTTIQANYLVFIVLDVAFGGAA